MRDCPANPVRDQSSIFAGKRRNAHGQPAVGRILSTQPDSELTIMIHRSSKHPDRQPDNRRHGRLRARILATLVLALGTANAHAYIDPGSGSFLLQIAMAAAVGAMFYLRQGMSAVRRFFGRILGKRQ